MLKKIKKRITNKETYYLVFSLPMAMLLLMAFPIFKIRLLRLSSDRIGHYAMNTELLCCMLENRVKTKGLLLFYTTTDPICNKQLHRMYRRQLNVMSMFPILWKQVDRLLTIVLRGLYASDLKQLMESRQGYQDTQGLLFSHKTPQLSFLPEEINKGRDSMQQLGLPPGAPYVCLLIRDAEYLNKVLPTTDWSYHNFRDADIDTYQKASLFLAEKGYYVLRMGKVVGKAFNIAHPNVIDYATHSLRSDFLDMYLPAHCEFFISTSSGLDAVAQIFRRPVLLTNIAPFSGQLQYWYPCELFITKKVKSRETGQWISYADIYRLFGHDGNVLSGLKRHNMELIDNSEDEILAVVQEMEARVRGAWVETEENTNLFHRFKSLAPFSMVADNAVILENPERFYTKLGTDFLRKNQSWIQ